MPSSRHSAIFLISSLPAYSLNLPPSPHPRAQHRQAKMRWSLPILVFFTTALALAKMPVAKYRDLPTLREQDALEKNWVQERYDFIPSVLKKQCAPSCFLLSS